MPTSRTEPAAPPASQIRPPTSRTLYDKANTLATSEDPPWPKVHQLLLRADAAGDLRATYALATWHLHGNSDLAIKRNLRRAIPMLEAAAQSVPDAMYDLAIAYELGAGTRANPAKAFYWYFR